MKHLPTLVLLLSLAACVPVSSTPQVVVITATPEVSVVTATRPPATPTYTPTTNPAVAELEDLQASGLVNLGGHFVPIQSSLTISEAQRDYWIFYPIEGAGTHQDFAIGADVSWHTASEKSDWWNTGCGFFIRPRDEDGTGGYFVGRTADRLPWLLWWKPSGGFLVDLLRPPSYDYLSAMSTGKRTGSQHIVAIAEGPTLRYLVDGAQEIYRDDIAERPGFLGAVVVSGTNKDYGTRCDFSNLWLYALDGGSGTSG